MQVPIVATAPFQFTEPVFCLGQKVRTIRETVGYVVGLDYYPESETWAYGIYVVNDQEQFLDEDWYEAEELVALD